MEDRLSEFCKSLSEESQKNSINLDTKQEILNELIGIIQNECIKTEVGKVVNKAIDEGIRIIFPEAVGEPIINLKNNIYDQGLDKGIAQTVDDAIADGKYLLGLESDEFESISQAQDVIKKGGTVDKISQAIDVNIDNLENNTNISEGTIKKLKNGKNKIVENVEKNIDISFENQIKDLEKLNKYISNWNDAYKNKDFSSMEKEYKKMNKVIENLFPTERTITDYRTIENLHTLIKNNGNNFDLTDEQIELANKLIH